MRDLELHEVTMGDMADTTETYSEWSDGIEEIKKRGEKMGAIITGWLKLSKSEKTVNIKDPHGNYLGFFHVSSLEKHQKGEIKSVPLMKLPTGAFKKKDDE